MIITHNPTRLAVIIINWNQAHLTCTCVQRIINNIQTAKTNIVYQIIVVDNGSTDNSATMISEQFPSIILIGLSHNQGFAKGVNCALRHPACNDTDLCLFINNDAYLAENALDRLLDSITNDSSDIVSPIIYTDMSSGHLWSAGSMIGKHTLRNINNRPSSRAMKSAITCDMVTFCIVLVPYAVFMQVGMLDESFFMYYEDWDFCLRSKQYGIRLQVNPNAVGYHAVAASTGGRWSSAERFLNGKSLIHFYRKNMRFASPFFASVYLIVYVVAYCVRMMLSKKLSATRAFLLGIWQGITET